MGFGAFLVTFCASKKLPGARGRAAPERLETNNFSSPPARRRTNQPCAQPPNEPSFMEEETKKKIKGGTTNGI